MASTQQSVEFDKTLHDVDVALEILTGTLSGIEGCEYPRLLAREIQALIIACIAHEKVRQVTADESHAEKPGQVPESTPPTTDRIKLMLRALEAREAEISNLRDLLRQGGDTIETHTLTDQDGTVVIRGDYQCIKAIEIEQWVDRAGAVLNPTGRSSERDRPTPTELRDRMQL